MIIDHGDAEKMGQHGAGRGKKVLTVKAVLRAYRACAGITTQAAQALAVDKCNLLSFVRRNNLKGKINEIRLDIIELAEENVFEALVEGDVKTSLYVLRCIGGDKWIPADKKALMRAIEANAIGLPPPSQVY